MIATCPSTIVGESKTHYVVKESTGRISIISRDKVSLVLNTKIKKKKV
jgi:hypothetical protein